MSIPIQYFSSATRPMPVKFSAAVAVGDASSSASQTHQAALELIAFLFPVSRLMAAEVRHYLDIMPNASFCYGLEKANALPEERRRQYLPEILQMGSYLPFESSFFFI